MTKLLDTGYLALRGRHVAKLPFRSHDTLIRYQTRNMKRIINHAFNHVPYYRELSHRTGVCPESLRTAADLAQLPLLDGRVLQENPTHFVSTTHPLAALHKIYSTGTSAYGSKTVYWPTHDLMVKAAYRERDRQVLRHLIGKAIGLRRLTFFHPDSSTAQSSRFYHSRLWIPSWIMQTHWASTALSVPEIVRRLNELRPDVVHSYGSFAESFLLAILERNLDVHLPKVWSFGGDGVTSHGRTRIERDLPIRLHSSYSAVESGRIGFECEDNKGYHINIDVCSIRLVDEKGSDVSGSTAGEVVLSNLINTGTILLNYRLGDYAMWGRESCSCGRNLPLLQLTGSRTSSWLQLRNGHRLQEHALLHACKERMHDVLNVRIVEHEPETITWKVVLRKGADPLLTAEDLERCSRSVMSPGATISIEFVDTIPLAHGEKLTRIFKPRADGHQS